MTDSPRGDWLEAPVGADEIVLHISVGDNVELSDDARVAIESLIDSFVEAEVTGHGMRVGFCGIGICFGDASGCGKYSCELGKCQPESRNPCKADYKCKIASFI